MEAAIQLISKIPEEFRIVCMVILMLVFFIPLFFHKKHKKATMHEMLRDTKIALEIKKLVLELDEKLNNYTDFGEAALQKYKNDEVQGQLNDEYNEHDFEEQPYREKIKFSISGSLFLFIITTIAILSSKHDMVSMNEYIAALARDSAVCIASGFAATFIPWGNVWYYFIYGFTIPILIATIIVIIT